MTNPTVQISPTVLLTEGGGTQYVPAIPTAAQIDRANLLAERVGQTVVLRYSDGHVSAPMTLQGVSIIGGYDGYEVEAWEKGPFVAISAADRSAWNLHCGSVENVVVEPVAAA